MSDDKIIIRPDGDLPARALVLQPDVKEQRRGAPAPVENDPEAVRSMRARLDEGMALTGALGLDVTSCWCISSSGTHSSCRFPLPRSIVLSVCDA